MVIDFRKSAEVEKDFRTRYAFIDWTKAETSLGGFDEQALDLFTTQLTFCVAPTVLFLAAFLPKAYAPGLDSFARSG